MVVVVVVMVLWGVLIMVVIEDGSDVVIVLWDCVEGSSSSGRSSSGSNSSSSGSSSSSSSGISISSGSGISSDSGGSSSSSGSDSSSCSSGGGSSSSSSTSCTSCSSEVRFKSSFPSFLLSPSLVWLCVACKKGTSVFPRPPPYIHKPCSTSTHAHVTPLCHAVLLESLYLCVLQHVCVYGSDKMYVSWSNYLC